METRRQPRVNVSLKVITEVAKSSTQKFSLAGGKSFDVKGVDISVSGVGVISKHFLPKGLIIELEIEGLAFGLREAIRVKARVCYCRYLKSFEYRCGMEFIDISPKYKDAIGKFISAHERRKDPRLKLSEEYET
ncbi:MAG: PilZ domain-containing protein [Candidatus Omnitrophota bacterium]